MSFARHFRDLDVYQNAKAIARSVFDVTKRFPVEEKYSLTDQVRRSSRSVCANIAEAWRKRRYKAAFVAKLSDAETEAAETQVWCELAADYEYLSAAEFRSLDDACDKVISQLTKMASEADRWATLPHADTPKRPNPDTR